MSLSIHQQAREYTSNELLTLILISGFGSLAFFRANVITLRVGDSDVGIGPSFVLETILAAADRSVDRKRAHARTRIKDIMSSVSFEDAKLVLPSYCFNLMQNVSADEQQKVALEVEALAGSDMPDRVKALNLGLMLLSIVGGEGINGCGQRPAGGVCRCRCDAHLGRGGDGCN